MTNKLKNYKEVVFFGRTKDLLSAMPDEIRRKIGHGLHLAQFGGKSENAKPLTGRKEFRGGKVLEIVADYDTDTFRGVYTVEFAEGIYVLDVFQKKSKRGIETPQQDIERIIGRLKSLRTSRDTPTGKANIATLQQRFALRQAAIDEAKAKSHEPK